MVLCNLLIPAVMLVFGFLFTKKAPKNINYIFGYRTARSMKNENTWEFAHKYLGKIWVKTAFALSPVALVPMFFVIEKSKDTVGTVGMVICYFEVAVLLLSIIPAERALKKNFDQNGERKVEQNEEVK